MPFDATKISAIDGDTLPADLVTGHPYCDRHHAALFELLDAARRALAAGTPRVAEPAIDTFTIVWLVHSLLEEEGMAEAIGRGVLAREVVANHTRTHVLLTKWWHANVLVPFKDGTADLRFLTANLDTFRGMGVQHVLTLDQSTYGMDSGRCAGDRARQVAHAEACGLPLSLDMPGCRAVLAALAPHMSRRIAPATLVSLDAGAGGRALPPIALSQYDERLWTGGKGAFRDVFVRTYMTLSERIARTGRSAA